MNAISPITTSARRQFLDGMVYIDEVTTKGRMVITSLDPFFHHGSHFMPATTRFLDGFLPWMREQLDQKQAA